MSNIFDGWISWCKRHFSNPNIHNNNDNKNDIFLKLVKKWIDSDACSHTDRYTHPFMCVQLHSLIIQSAVSGCFEPNPFVLQLYSFRIYLVWHHNSVSNNNNNNNKSFDKIITFSGKIPRLPTHLARFWLFMYKQ